MHGLSRRRLALGAAGTMAAMVGFAIAVAPGLADAAGSSAATETGTGTTESPAKAVLCHKSKVTIRVSTNAWPAHHRHGDTMGACTHAQLVKAKQTKQAKDDQEREAGEDEGPGKGKARGTSKGKTKDG